MADGGSDCQGLPVDGLVWRLALGFWREDGGGNLCESVVVKIVTIAESRVGLPGKKTWPNV
jgi:hypothetical protein